MINEPIISPPDRTKEIIALVVFGIIVVAIVWWFTQNFQKPEPILIPEPDPKLGYEVTQSPAGALPEQFPRDFPLEAQSLVDNSYNVYSPDKFQATVHFESGNTLEKSFKTYSDYLTKKNGWTVQNTLNTPLVKSITAENTEGTLVTVNMAQNRVNKLNQITISFIYKNETIK